MKSTTCYMCERPATTREHVPPKGFFPKPSYKYRGGRHNYRSNLITVPACDEHNNAKSNDDGYVQALIAVLASSYKGEFQEGRPPHFIEEWVQRIKSGPRLRRTFYESARAGVIDGGVALTVETDALYRVMDGIARALYYHEFSGTKKWPGKCAIRIPHLQNNDGSAQFLHDHIRTLDNLFLGRPLHGVHPDIFYSQLLLSPVVAMKFTFYRAFRVLALSDQIDPDGSLVEG